MRTLAAAVSDGLSALETVTVKVYSPSTSAFSASERTSGVDVAVDGHEPPPLTTLHDHAALRAAVGSSASAEARASSWMARSVGIERSPPAIDATSGASAEVTPIEASPHTLSSGARQPRTTSAHGTPPGSAVASRTSWGTWSLRAGLRDEAEG